MNQDDKIQEFWEAYLTSLSNGMAIPDSFDVWHFGNNKNMANELGALVKAGMKTATCSLYWSYEIENEVLPKVGSHSVITNWEGQPICIIEAVGVEVKAFNQVDEHFAYEEGEGDRSLNYWREVHWRFFSKECEEIGCQPSKEMPLVCERFRVVFPTD
jgi:uncharacterized protein YhfF